MLLLRGEPAACLSWQRGVERQYRPSLQTLNLSRAAAAAGCAGEAPRVGRRAGHCLALPRHRMLAAGAHSLSDLDAVLAS